MAFRTYSPEDGDRSENEVCDACSVQTLDMELLPCTHVVCVRCFEEAAVASGSSTGCVICDSKVVVTPSPFACHLCSDDVAAISYCTNCCIYLCEFCEQAHYRQKRTASHQVNPLEQQRVTEPVEHQPLPTCPHFDSNTIGFFCEYCYKCICSQCKVDNHSDHTTISMNDMSLNCFERLQNLLSKTQPLVSTLKDSINTIDVLMATIEDNVEQASECVCQVIDTHISLLEEHKVSLLTELNEIKKHKLYTLSRQISCLSHALTSIHTACNTTSHVLAMENELSNALSAKLSLAQTLEELTVKRYEYRPQEDDYVHFIPSVPAGRRRGYEINGVIDTLVPSSNHSIISKDDLIVKQWYPTSLTLTVLDKEGTRKVNGGDFIDLRVQNISGSQLKSKVIDANNGSYELVFTPDSPGEHRISVLMGNRHVQGSPRLINVQSTKKHLGVFHCCSYCTTEGKMNYPCACDGVEEENSGCNHDYKGHPGCYHWSCCGSKVDSFECLM